MTPFPGPALRRGGPCIGAPGFPPVYGDYFSAAFVDAPAAHHTEGVVDCTPPRYPAPPLRNVGISVKAQRQRARHAQ
ncbi:glyoxalase [Xanthomonas euvesicatoria]|nr:glyoxalase [Xanthomonas euvesicatoria]